MTMRISIESLTDPRVAHYRNLKDRDLSAHSDGSLFVAEGEQVVRRLIASRFEVDSVFVSETRADKIAPIVPDSVPLYVGPSEVVNGVLGFKFHSGVMAVGRRSPRLSLSDIVPARGEPAAIVVCPEIANTENLGSLIRISAAFGVDGMILGERSCDPFFRQSVRVSMGTAFSLPILQSQDWTRDLKSLRDEHGVKSIASVLDKSADSLAAFTRPPRFAILFGNEAQGLSDAAVARCEHRVTIPMKLGTDSLNVGIAAAVFLYELTKEPQ